MMSISTSGIRSNTTVNAFMLRVKMFAYLNLWLTAALLLNPKKVATLGADEIV